MKYSDAQNYLLDFEKNLVKEDKAPATVKKYVGDVRIFLEWCDKKHEQEISLQILQHYREDLFSRRKMSGCNSVLISLNKFFARYSDTDSLHVRLIKTQRQTSLDKIFSLKEYNMLLNKALEIGNKRLYCIMRVLASSGIRVGELAYIKVETLCMGRCMVSNKGKVREIFIPYNVCQVLLEYCSEVHIETGMIFCSPRNPNKLIDRGQLWRDFNKLERLLNFPKGTVHAHSFRHFFAKQYFCLYKDLGELADILGHASIETTRIYTRTTAFEKKTRIEALNL